MNDLELDRLLAAAVIDPPESVAREAEVLAVSTMPRRLRAGRTPRRRWLLPVVITGAVALTAAASLSAVQLSHWPWVTMPDGNVHSDPIPVAWTTDDGHTEHCRAWVELRDAGDGDLAALNAAIGARDWTGLGQKLYDGGVASPDDDADGESRVMDGLSPELISFTQSVLPGVLVMAQPGDGVGIDASGMNCRQDDR